MTEWQTNAVCIPVTVEMAEDIELFRRAHAELQYAIMAGAKLTREIGPMHGPGRREYYRATRGQRLLAEMPGRPVGSLFRGT